MNIDFLHHWRLLPPVALYFLSLHCPFKLHLASFIIINDSVLSKTKRRECSILLSPPLLLSLSLSLSLSLAISLNKNNAPTLSPARGKFQTWVSFNDRWEETSMVLHTMSEVFVHCLTTCMQAGALLHDNQLSNQRQTTLLLTKEGEILVGFPFPPLWLCNLQNKSKQSRISLHMLTRPPFLGLGSISLSRGRNKSPPS